MASAPPHDPDLLQVLHALVGADGGAPGLTGRIVIGIKTRPPRWWMVDLGDTATGRFIDEPPPDADAWLGVGAVEAAAVLGKATMPPEPSVVAAGDRELLERFFRRYLPGKSLLGLRAEASR